MNIRAFALHCRPIQQILAVLLTILAFSGNSVAGQAKLAWDAVANATGYKVYYGQSSGSYSASIDVKNVTSYTVTGLTDGARYYFAVTDYNATAASGYSNEVNTVVSSTSAPVAGFTATPTSGTAPVAVSFADTSTGSITSRSWNFGNGSTSTAQNPSYTYTSAGSYTVTLTVTGSGGSNKSTKTITVSAATGGGGSGSGGTAGNANGLVAAYGFEEASGTQVIDTSGYANHGVISGATRTTTSQFGRALKFNGVNNWVTVNDSSSLDLTTGVTLEAWVYPTVSLSGWITAVTKERPGGLAYSVYANSYGNQPSNIENVGGTDRILYAGSRLPVNAWTHLAVTYDGSTQKLYVNGALAGSRAQTGAITLSNGVLRIGGNSVWGEYFNGYIDEVRVYNRPLSQTEIAADSKLAVVGLIVSTSSNRANSVPLNGGAASGNIYVSYTLISPTAATKPAKQVKFWLDDPKPTNPTGTPRLTDTSSPFDFAGTNSDGTARAFSTTGLAKGLHTITAQVTLSDGTVLPYITGTFKIP